jgi:hypothetical protein
MMRKFTKVVKYVFEKDIEKLMDKDQDGVKQKVQATLNQASIKKSLQEEMNEDKYGGSGVLKKMDDATKEFVEMFGKKGAKLKDEEIDEALKRTNGGSKIPSTLTIKKREAEEEVESLEKEVSGKKSKKKKSKE